MGFAGLSDSDKDYYTHLAIQQIELIFSSDSLSMDTFVRSYMDQAGYVPVGKKLNYFVTSFRGLNY